MGRPAEYSVEQIIEAGQKVQKEGKVVSGVSIREKLGSVGKAERYKKIWDEYTLSQSNDIPPEPVVVEEATRDRIAAEMQIVGEKIIAVVAELNHNAKIEAETKIAEIKQLADKRTKDSEQQLESATRQIDELEQKTIDIQAEHETMCEIFAGLKNEKQQADIEAAKIAERLLSTEKALDHSQRLVETIKNENTLNKEEITRLAEVKAKLEINNSQLQQQLESMAKNFNDESKKVSELQEEKGSLSNNIGNLKSEIQKAEISLTQLKERQKHSELSLEQVKTELEQAKKTIEREVNLHEKTRDELAKMRELVANKDGQLEMLNKQLQLAKAS